MFESKTWWLSASINTIEAIESRRSDRVPLSPHMRAADILARTEAEYATAICLSSKEAMACVGLITNSKVRVEGMFQALT